MNVTVKLPDELCRQARHRAVDANQSLSAWLADLIRREIEGSEPEAVLDTSDSETSPPPPPAKAESRQGSFVDQDFPL